MTFNDITLGQFQMLYRISKDESLDYLDKTTESVACITGKTSRQVEEMSIKEFNSLAADVSKILSTTIEAKPKRIISANGKRYGITYEPAKLRAGQYIEIQHFLQGDFVENINYILSSLTYPVYKIGWITFGGKNDSSKHEQIANDLLDAKMIDVYSACVFFCEILKASITGLRDCFEKVILMETGKKTNLSKLMADFTVAMDGFITLNRLPITRT